MNAAYCWDASKAAENRLKHGIAFTEAATVFADPLSKLFDDPDHSVSEQREIIVGMLNRQRLLLVVLIERDDGGIRIISARRATANERTRHEENS